LAGKIIQTMINTLEQFQTSGLRNYTAQWPLYDALANQSVTLIDKDNRTDVIARGINDKGELQYQLNDELHTLSNSHVSIRFSS